ncbi:hypothetical protein ABB37_06271 [Leptomonas pyrrhocoris]|uniref:Uncharacterized protein n=1 Tax=Leptomonas pyrrhocoris TaxID=157538 RepID=A0A0N1J4P1_LEPPY|nr:hypothetical protein ABB37_06271 [Leptomonas pyrrhocoris]KPA78671.1 hypothetical protein ABB37_06271 [Leptomonas pyrrhocoris]|eukprot:XP_015657110.1 hypothetical protein ABB37_06271 [Leptomonas pyrrhocoris]
MFPRYACSGSCDTLHHLRRVSQFRRAQKSRPKLGCSPQRILDNFTSSKQVKGSPVNKSCEERSEKRSPHKWKRCVSCLSCVFHLRTSERVREERRSMIQTGFTLDEVSAPVVAASTATVLAASLGGTPTCAYTNCRCICQPFAARDNRQDQTSLSTLERWSNGPVPRAASRD